MHNEGERRQSVVNDLNFSLIVAEKQDRVPPAGRGHREAANMQERAEGGGGRRHHIVMSFCRDDDVRVLFLTVEERVMRWG